MSQLIEVKDVPVFRAGDYGEKGKYSADDIWAIAEGYDPSWLEAPVTPDHVQEGPAWGWVKSLRAAGSELFATLRVPADVFALITEGRYRRRSVEIYRNFTLRDGRSRLYLKAVSVLGAATPQVKGLGPLIETAAFSHGLAEAVAIAFGETGKPKARTFSDFASFRTAAAERADELEAEHPEWSYLDCLAQAERELRGIPDPQTFTELDGLVEQAKKSHKTRTLSDMASFRTAVAERADQLEAEHPDWSYRDCLAEAERLLAVE